jgi:YD repeat-containing protein
MDRLLSRTDPIQGTTSTETYQYDLAGNVDKITSRKGQVTRYQYDGLNRMIFAGFGAVGTPPTATYDSTINYSYDAANRLLQAVDSLSGTITRTYNDQTATITEATPQGSVTYKFDAVARRTQMTVAGQQPVNYSYDAANRLITTMQIVALA